MVICIVQTSLHTLESSHVWSKVVQHSIQYFQVYSIDQDTDPDHTQVYTQPLDWPQDHHPWGHTHIFQGYSRALPHDTITEAYHNSSTIPINELTSTFGIPLTIHIEQATFTMEAWLLQHQAGQKCCASIFTQEDCMKSTNTRFLIFCTCGCFPNKPPT